MKKFVVFDWNGTLLMDVRECMTGDNAVLKAFGGKQVDLETYQETIRIPVIDFYVEHGCDRAEIMKKKQEASDIFFKTYKALADRATLREGTKELLAWLREHAIAAVILSNHSPEGIQHHLGRFGIGEFFADVLADVGDTSLLKQGKGERLKHYMDAHHLRPREGVIIGDTAEETSIGREWGLATVAITNGYFSESRLRTAKPDYLVHSLREFQAIVRS